MKLLTCLQIAGLLHFGLLLAGASMPKAVNLREHLSMLPPFIRQLYWVYFSFIGLTLVSLGLLTLASAHAMAAGEPVARRLCLFIAVFWWARLGVAGFVFDVRPYLTDWFYWLGYQATNVVFVFLAGTYTWAALKGGA